ncbi:MAG: hypothetical protein IH899_01815 [Planctomycetes bacterium]|nr:hypothetical protein [Planctomycetota bacterium]
MFTKPDGRKVHVLQMDVGELPDLKNFPVIPENQEIQRKLTLKWGLREREPGEQNDDSAPRSFYLGRLKDIHAVQLLSEQCMMSHASSTVSTEKVKVPFYSYEINLVLRDASRKNVIDQGNLDRNREDAKTLAQFLKVSLWDTT